MVEPTAGRPPQMPGASRTGGSGKIFRDVSGRGREFDLSKLKPHHRLYLSALLLDCALMAGGTAVPFYIFDRLGGGAGMSGVIAGMQSLFYAALSLVSSRYVARSRDSMKWADLGTILYGVVYSASVLTTNPYVFAVVSTSGFMCLALVFPAQWSWLGAEPDVAVRVRLISQYNVAWSIGIVIGPLLAGPLYAIDYRLPFALVFVLSGIAVWLQYTIPRERLEYERPAPPELEAGQRRNVQSFLYAAWFANFLGWVLLLAGRSVFPKRVADLAEGGQIVFLAGHAAPGSFLTQGALVFSWLSFAMNCARLLVFLLMGLNLRWRNRMTLVVLAEALGAAGCWVLSWTTSFLAMLVCCGLIGLAGGVCFFFSAFYSLADRQKKHQRAAVNETMVGAGSFAGASGFGLLASRYGVDMPFRWAPAMVLVSIGVQHALVWYGKRSVSRPARGE